MIDWITGQPFWIAAIALTAVAAVRSQSTYWLGRAIRAGLLRGQWAKRFNTDRVGGAIDKLERWGWPLIPLSFLTVGFQTAVNLAAGLIGWRWLKYTLAAIPGWIVWGCMYAAGGLVLFAGAWALVARSPFIGSAVIAAVIGVVALVIWRRRKRRTSAALEQVGVEQTSAIQLVV